MSTSEPSSIADDCTSAIIYMSGDRRGTTELLGESTRFITREGRSGVRIAKPREMPDPDVAAIIRVSENTHELEVMPHYKIWVNGDLITSKPLESGDVLEVGRNGPMLRYRKYIDGVIPRRSMADVFTDCFDGARYEQGPLVKKTSVLIGGFTEEFLTRTTLPFRLVVLLVLLVMIATVGFLVQNNIALEQRIARGESQMRALSTLIEQTESKAITREDVLAMRGELEGDISTAVERVEALELRRGAAARIVSAASQSVIFLQGAYGFVHSATNRPLRYLEPGAAKSQELALQGGRAITLDGDGPLVELQYTGTGFVATEGGLVITNRHVAQPWRNEAFAAVASTMGLSPSIHRFIGYLPGRQTPFEVKLVSVSEEADVAILSCTEIAKEIPPIRAGNVVPNPGDEVIVLGYPTGVRAMLARTDERFLDELRANNKLDFWSLGEQLARAGHIKPLATRGIVGQVTSSTIVYDAGTAHGGSGGPVMNLDGLVVAVNAAILKEFGGSNLGVPIERATALISNVRSEP